MRSGRSPVIFARCVMQGLVWLLLLPPLALAVEAPLWFDEGRPTPLAFEALAILGNAALEGLEPETYSASHLQSVFAAANQTASLPAAQIAMLDQHLTTAMERYLRHLHCGRIDPSQIQEEFAAPKKFDPKALLRAAIRDNRLALAVEAATPPQPYADLRQALARYRNLAADLAVVALWERPLSPLPDKLEPGQFYADLPLVAERLMALGDLPPNSLLPTTYGPEIVAGIQAFQTRHGLNPDGVIGRLTWRRLAVPPAVRVRQIELAMERLRWTPQPQAPRSIVVNIPENMLEAFEVQSGRAEIKTRMRVISGNARETRTPIFHGDIRSIEFSPRWNIPFSIARKEILPKIMSDPASFEAKGYEFVHENGLVQTVLTLDSLEAVRRGALRLRQRPGPANPMGDIKFVIPNKDSIYLHHTASPRLFQHDRRDLSHGCIRVEDPVALALFVQDNDPAWGKERIQAAMTQATPTVVRLASPVRVLIVYTTVRVRDGGQVHFFPDVYGQDKLLDQALRLKDMPPVTKGEV